MSEVAADNADVQALTDLIYNAQRGTKYRMPEVTGALLANPDVVLRALPFDAVYAWLKAQHMEITTPNTPNDEYGAI